MHDTDILEKTLMQMPVKFTGNSFANAARANGLADGKIRNGIATRFLRRHAMQAATRKTWVRLDTDKNICSIALTDAQCIEHLKARGYRIEKPVTTYEYI